MLALHNGVVQMTRQATLPYILLLQYLITRSVHAYMEVFGLCQNFWETLFWFPHSLTHPEYLAHFECKTGLVLCFAYYA